MPALWGPCSPTRKDVFSSILGNRISYPCRPLTHTGLSLVSWCFLMLSVGRSAVWTPREVQRGELVQSEAGGVLYRHTGSPAV